MIDIPGFIKRFTIACGTDRPADVARRLNIPYQSAKNYLNGRVPTAAALIEISERTKCSIDWLLLGRGKKFIDDAPGENTPLVSRQLEEIGRVVVEVINDLNVSHNAAQHGIVGLQSSEVASEEAVELARPPSASRP